MKLAKDSANNAEARGATAPLQQENKRNFSGHGALTSTEAAMALFPNMGPPVVVIGIPSLIWKQLEVLAEGGKLQERLEHAIRAEFNEQPFRTALPSEVDQCFTHLADTIATLPHRGERRIA